jgi:hypothetical protein
MKDIILVAVLLLSSLASGQKTACQSAILQTMNDSISLMNQFLLSGKFINELGNYPQCDVRTDKYKYSMAVIYTDAKNISAPKYVWGFCI